MLYDFLKFLVQTLPLTSLPSIPSVPFPNVSFETISVPSADTAIRPATINSILEKTPVVGPYGRYQEPVEFPPDYCRNMSENEEWDFIVVGSGPGGSSVARRLAENPAHKVLLVEAGTDPPSNSFLPSKAAIVMATSTWRLNAVTTHHECKGLLFSSCIYNPGKCLGGGSVVYYMMYVRGNKEDYNEWASWGNEGWAYDDVLPYFKKFENYNASNYDPKYHGKGGPLLVSDWAREPYSDRIRDGLFAAAEEVGLKRTFDNNGERQIGPVSLVAAATDIGYRVTVAEAYLKNLPFNMKVCKEALVSKVNLSKNNRAKSVSFVHQDLRSFKVRARKEVILSAGALLTPGILERSGIGKRDVLESANVQVRQELPGVGEHLEDHFVNMGCAFALKVDTQKPMNPLALGLSSFTMFVNTSDFNHPVPTTQYLLFIHEDILAIGLNFEPSLAVQLSALSNSTSLLVYFASCVLQPTNNGYVHIWDSNPKSKPIALSHHMRNRYELEETIRGVRLARRMFLETESMKVFEPQPFKMKECEKYEFNSDDEIVCSAQQLANSVNHSTGTAKMGPDSDPLAVVDSRLRVKGVKGLRVVDASVFPEITRGNTLTTTLMIGEKAADMIKEDHKNDPLSV